MSSITRLAKGASPIHHRPPVTINPNRQVAFARSNPIPALLWILVILVGLQVVRAGTLPSRQQTFAWLAGGVIVVLSATVAPELVTAILLAVLILTLITEVPFITPLINQFGTFVDSAVPNWQEIQTPFGGMHGGGT